MLECYDLFLVQFNAGCQRVNLGFLIDSSGSIVGQQDIWIYVQSFITRIIGRLNVGLNASEVAVVQFSTIQQVIFNFTTYFNKSAMYNAVENNMNPLSQNTNTSGGLK